MSTLADDWAARDAPVSFKDFEQAIRQVVFAFARIAIMLFLALREEQLMRARTRPRSSAMVAGSAAHRRSRAA